MRDALTEHYLLTAASLQAFIAHVDARDEHADRDALIDAWRHAQDVMERIAEQEEGCADEPGILALPEPIAAQVDALTRVPQVSRAFSRLPVMFGMIELDATMAGRPSMNEESLSRYQGLWDADIDDGELARACLPSDLPEPRATRARLDGDTFTIVGDADDLQYLGAAVQRGDAAARLEGPGCVDAGLQLSFGRVPNLVHALRFDGRLLLVDGLHRARVLRALGQTFVPAVISVCADLDDVRSLAPQLGGADLGRWFGSARPPMLRDFDLQPLVHRYRARVLQRALQLRITASELLLP